MGSNAATDLAVADEETTGALLRSDKGGLTGTVDGITLAAGGRFNGEDGDDDIINRGSASWADSAGEAIVGVVIKRIQPGTSHARRGKTKIPTAVIRQMKTRQRGSRRAVAATASHASVRRKVIFASRNKRGAESCQ
jgi:hypothetical protein